LGPLVEFRKGTVLTVHWKQRRGLQGCYFDQFGGTTRRHIPHDSSLRVDCPLILKSSNIENCICVFELFSMNSKQGRQLTYNGTLWHVHVTIVALETQQRILFALFSYVSPSAMYRNTEY